MVEEFDAVVHPGALAVHFLDSSATFRAVTRKRRLETSTHLHKTSASPPSSISVLNDPSELIEIVKGLVKTALKCEIPARPKRR